MIGRLIFCLFFLLLPSFSFAQDFTLQHFQQLKTNPPLKKQFEAVVRQTVHQLYFPDEPVPSLKLDSWFSKPLPLFVTVKKKDRIRACMGSVLPQTAHLADELKQKIRLAFLQDIRNPPIKKEELEGSRVYVTAVGALVPVSHPENLNPFREGIYLKWGGKEALYLPGEAKTLAYALKQIRGKAGISSREPALIYKFKTSSVEVDLFK
ncbi:MAG: AMMECR1 domain-containing protein [Deltaproteobacteria bacterium]|nr:AMMECR1 domain-containing protein [Deltaproteobacteria bacterium]